MGWLIILAFVGFLTFVFTQRPKYLRKQKALADEMEREIAALPSFSPSLQIDQPDKALAVLIDPDSEQFAIAKIGSSATLYSFDQLVAVDVERNGSSIQKTNRGSQAIGAAVGGVLLGPLGLLVGGLSGSKRKVELVKRLTLKLYTNDLQIPFHEVVFLANGAGLKPDAPEVKQAAQRLDEWYGRFRAILQE